MKQALFLTASAAVLVLACSCAPMIENGRDHRHDPQFKKQPEQDPKQRRAQDQKGQDATAGLRHARSNDSWKS